MKKRIITQYSKLPQEVKKALKLKFPEGFEDELINMKDINGATFKALIFEYGEIIYLIRNSRINIFQKDGIDKIDDISKKSIDDDIEVED